MGKFITLYKYLLLRWREPSTHAALAAVCLQMGIQLNDGMIGSWFTVAGLAFGAAGVLQKEGDKNAG